MIIFPINENVRPFRSGRFVFLKAVRAALWHAHTRLFYIPVSSSSVPVLIISVSDLHSIVGLGKRRESPFLNGENKDLHYYFPRDLLSTKAQPSRIEWQESVITWWIYQLIFRRTMKSQ